MSFTDFNKNGETYRTDEGTVIKKGRDIIISCKEDNENEIVELLKAALKYFNDMSKWKYLQSKRYLIEEWVYRFDDDKIFHVFVYDRGELCLQMSGNLEWYHNYVKYYFVNLHDIRCDLKPCGNQEIGMEHIVKNNGTKIVERYLAG